MVRRGKRAEDSPETAFERLGTAVHVFSPDAAVTAEKRTLEGRRLHGNVSFGRGISAGRTRSRARGCPLGFVLPSRPEYSPPPRSFGLSFRPPGPGPPRPRSRLSGLSP